MSTVVADTARRTVEAERARAEAEILVRLTATVTTDDPLRSLITHLRSSFGLDGVAILDRREAAWHVVVSTGSDVPSRPEEADVVDELGPDVVLALRGRQLTVDDRRVLAAFGDPARRGPRTHPTLGCRGLGRRARAGERAAGRAPASGVPRPPHAVGGDQGVGLEPAPGRRDLGRRTRAREFLAAIEEQTDRLTVLVGNLLDMSRLQAGVLEPQLRAVAFDEVVPAAIASLVEGAARVDADVSETLPPVEADPALLERVVANLLSNAIAHSPDGAKVHVAAGTVNRDVTLHVIDHGPGIPRLDRARVFEPFQRAGDQRSATGVGLGLAVARGFVEAMHGELHLDDTPGGGLTAIITLRAAS